MSRIGAGFVSGVWVLLIFVAGFDVVLNVPKVLGSGTIYIRADGSIDPPTAPISTLDEITYTLTGDFDFGEPCDGIVVERSNVIIEGEQHTIQGTEEEQGRGLYLSDLSNVTIRSVNVINFEYGVYLASCSLVTVKALRYVHASSAAIKLESSSNCSICGNNLSTHTQTAKIEIDSESNTNEICQNTGVDGDHGMIVQGSNNRIWGNTMTNDAGLDLSGSNNSVFGNAFGGVYVSGSSNTFDGNSGAAVLVYGTNNTFSRNKIYGGHGWGYTLSLEGFNHTVTGNDIDGGYHCVALGAAYGCNVSGNRLQSADSGVVIASSSNNAFSGNNITNNDIGIKLAAGASDNYIIHNNFIDNTQQVDVTAPGTPSFWDDGYPSGGNYWSDYDGYDSFSGPYQNETGSDGIGDVPYPISAENRDNYPIMTPFEMTFEFDIAILGLLPSRTMVPRGTPLSVNATVSNKGFYQSPLTFNLTVKLDFLDDIYSPVQRDFRLEASAAQGWNYTIPGPDITCFLGDLVALTLEGVDAMNHRFYVDYNGNDLPDGGEPQSPPFISTTIAYNFTADTVGNFTYYCAYNQNTMFGNFSINPWPPTPVISTRRSVTLLHKEEKNVTFTWDTTGWYLGDYQISSFTDRIPGEIDTDDNTFAGGIVAVTISGDVDGDFDVDASDLLELRTAYGSTLWSPTWNANCDINGDNKVDALDLFIHGKNYGQSFP